MIKQNLHKIIKDLIEVRGESGLKVSDEALWLQACTYDRGESMDKSKSQQNKSYSSGTPKLNTSDTSDSTRKETSADRQIQIPATRNQIEYLKKQGVKVDANLTKQEAFIMIRNYKESLKEGNI